MTIDTAASPPRPEGNTLPAVFWNAVKMRGDTVWMREKDLGIWRSWSWNRTGEAVREVAHGLMAIGLEPGDRVSILSNTVVEWVLADLGTLCAGGVARCSTCAKTPAR
jgi:long-chain acyl-CoA synthetase